ncbi:GGDEF domain-containing protein [Ferdinandcohnia quinoae]|uniref:GGDEF domain-containing protein n=1 Tax=Fredinandcohnia quinoae TaxID=2918902 RepID=A0AAW5E1Y0_9BACI|nr:GGDEF domain-containing protein [Fredinandcohnia sp. SECRCQ15]MCH1624006.1 GGDEF domain-containing protein [Fredinandcohnia sp. SECRCQ15]
MYYFPVISFLAKKHVSIKNNIVLLISLIASVLTFINLAFKPSFSYIDFIKGCVFLLSYFGLGYGIMMYQLRLKESIIYSRTDHLTKALNKHTGEITLVKEVTLAKKKGFPISIAFCDIDKFKKVNDTYGHLCGDMVIKETALLLKEHSPQGTQIVRWGGEEFLLIFKGMAIKNAFDALENVRKQIESDHFIYHNESIHITMSGGIVDASDYEHDIQKTLIEADKLLYQAKDLGRNRILSTIK